MFAVRPTPIRNAALAVAATAAITLILAAGLSNPPHAAPADSDTPESCAPEPVPSGATPAVIEQTYHPLAGNPPLPIDFGVDDQTTVTLTWDDCTSAETFTRTGQTDHGRVVFSPLPGLAGPSGTW